MTEQLADASDPDGAPPSASLWSGSRRPLTIGLVLVVTLVAFEAIAIATAMPSAERELGGLRFYGWTFGAFLLASLVGITWAGEECDLRGPARPLAVGLAFFAAGLTISGFAPEMWVVVLGRGIQGLGAGAVPAVAYVAIGRGYDEHSRPRMFAILSSAYVIPGLVGPAVAGSVAEYLSWRLVFLGLLPLVGVAAALTLPVVRSIAPQDQIAQPERRVLGAMRLAVGAGALLGGLASTSLYALPLIVVGGGVAMRSLLQLVPAGTLSASAGLPAAIAGNALLSMAFFGTEAFVPLMLIRMRGQSPVVAGLALTCASLTWASGSWIQARASDTWERRAMVRAGFAMVGGAIALVALALWPVVPVWVVPLAWSIGGLGMGLAYPSFSLMALSMATDGEEGRAAASLKLNEVLGAAMGAGIGGAIIAAGVAADMERASLVAVFTLMFGAALVGTLLAARLPSNARTAATPAGHRPSQ